MFLMYRYERIIMPQTYKVDQAATFSGIVLLSVEPKAIFGSDEQDRNSDGVPRWEAQCVCAFRQFGRTVNEVIKVGLTSHINPMDQLKPYEPVELVDLELGVVERKNRAGEITGFQVWHRVSEIRPISAVARPFRAVGSADGGS